MDYEKWCGRTGHLRANRCAPCVTRTDGMSLCCDLCFSVVLILLLFLYQYLIINLGISRGFGRVDLEHLRFPAKMLVDYVRVYQPQSAINVGCDPKDFPTKDYIARHQAAYTNPNLTTWVDDYAQAWPRNTLVDRC